MKKSVSIIIALALALAFSTSAFAAGPSEVKEVSAFAAGTVYAQRRNANRSACTFEDNDNDGICDNFNTRSNFVDENGDGVCDNRDNTSSLTCSCGASGSNDGRGYAQGRGTGAHHGRNCIQ